MRLFVSLPLDEPMRRHLASIAAAVFIEDQPDDVRWVPPENLHVTLKFLGEVADAEVPDVIAVLGRVRPAGPVRISAGPPDSKRHAGRVRLIAAEVTDIEGHLAFLRDCIERELEPLGFGREKRAFWPHITIGRSRNGVEMWLQRFKARGVVSVIDHFELMSSTLGPSGPRYVPVAKFPLTRSG